MCLQLADDLAQDLDRHWPRTVFRHSYSHHETLGILRSAAVAGCHFCTLICSQGSLTRLNKHSDSTPYSLQIQKDEHNPVWVRYFFSNERHYDIYIATNDERCAVISWLYGGWSNPGTIPMTLRFPSTGNPKVLDLARLWLEGCMATHDQCRLPTIQAHPVRSPTRLLRISASNGSISNVRLVQKPNLLGSKGYLTLSHRWGGADVIKLTTDTLDLFLMKLPLERLPRNFLDAVLVTVHLGFEFLWIDSLCIIQNSETDWQQESKNMGRIYRHAQCTIAAVEAQDSYGSLFRERNELELTCCQLLGSQQGGSNLLWATKKDQDQALQPLFKRAWVMQEQCLSRRILEFGLNEISWKCIAGSASERYPSLEVMELGDARWDEFNRQAERMLVVLDDQESIGNCDALSHDLINRRSGHWLQVWWNVIREYTRRDLTYATDRAAAISGLINLISEARGVPVAYGMWIPYLVSDLLWCAYLPAEGRVAIEYPSWSWFGVGVGITHKVPKYWESEILDHGAATVSIDQTVSLQRAGILNNVLKITAHILEVRQSSPLPGMYAGSSIGTRYMFRLRNGRNQKQGCQRLQDLEDWDGQWVPDITFDPNWNLKAIQFMETIHREFYRGEAVSYKENTGLMVVPVDEEARVYSRVGWYSIEWKIEKGKRSYKSFYKRVNRGKKHMRERRLGERQTIWLV